MRKKVLLSAYACEPDRGSESAVGWYAATELSKYHTVWVITRANNKSVIENKLPLPDGQQLNFIYYDLPKWLRVLKRKNRGVHLYYFLWQIAIYFVVRRYHQRVTFNVIHHVTFAMYWIPSFLVFLPVPFIFGPVGGGEKIPKKLLRKLKLKDRIHEYLRKSIKWCCEHSFLLAWVVNKSAVVIPCNADTKRCLEQLGINSIKVLSQVSLKQSEIDALNESFFKKNIEFNFISAGTLNHTKGVDIGLKAFAKANIKNAKYWVVGDGEHFTGLKKLVNQLGIQSKVIFFGQLTRRGTMKKFKEAHVLVYPSLHDSGGFVCVEAMAAGCPVICLNVGGPPEIVSNCGMIIFGVKPDEIEESMSLAMVKLEKNRSEYHRLKKMAISRIQDHYCVEKTSQTYLYIYERIIRT